MKGCRSRWWWSNTSWLGLSLVMEHHKVEAAAPTSTRPVGVPRKQGKCMETQFILCFGCCYCYNRQRLPRNDHHLMMMAEGARKEPGILIWNKRLLERLHRSSCPLSHSRRSLGAREKHLQVPSRNPASISPGMVALWQIQRVPEKHWIIVQEIVCSQTGQGSCTRFQSGSSFPGDSIVGYPGGHGSLVGQNSWRTWTCLPFIPSMCNHPA